MTNALWYLGRGSGVVTLVLITLVVALGIATRSGAPLPGLPRFAVAAIHRNASLLGVTFLGIHVVTLLFDPYAQLRLLDVVLPFQGTYRPLWLGLGTVALDLLAALVVTSLVRHRLGVRAWKALHWTSYAMWPLALIHALGIGTDSGQGWLRLTAVACGVLVGGAVFWRMSSSFQVAGRPNRLPERVLEPVPAPPTGVETLR